MFDEGKTGYPCPPIRECEPEGSISFRTLAENSSDVIMLFDRECRHLYANPAVEKQTGIPAVDEVIAALGRKSCCFLFSTFGRGASMK